MDLGWCWTASSPLTYDRTATIITVEEMTVSWVVGVGRTGDEAMGGCCREFRVVGGVLESMERWVLATVLDGRMESGGSIFKRGRSGDGGRDQD